MMAQMNKQAKLELRKANAPDDDDEDISQILADLRGSNTKNEDSPMVSGAAKKGGPTKQPKKYYIPKKQRELILLLEGKGAVPTIPLPPKDITATCLYQYIRKHIFGNNPNDNDTPDPIDANLPPVSYEVKHEPSISFSNFSESYFDVNVAAHVSSHQLFSSFF